MSDFMKYAYDLSDEIGPRPANTEEEHQAAEKIAGWFSEGGVSADVEEFNCPTASRWPYLVAYLLMFVAAFCTRFHGTLAIIMFVIALLALALFVCERYVQPFFGKMFGKGLSQNVVARYVPQGDAKHKTRKIIVMARYDSSHATPESSRYLVNLYPVLQIVMLACMVAVPLLMLFQLLPPFRSARSMLWIITLVVSLVPLIGAVFILIRRFAMRYPDGANDNASGVAAMMEVFNRMVGISDEDVPVETAAHDEQKAYEADVVPDDARLHYEASRRSAVPEETEDVIESGITQEAEPVSADMAYAEEMGGAEPLQEEDIRQQPAYEDQAQSSEPYEEMPVATQPAPADFTIPNTGAAQQHVPMQLVASQAQRPQAPQPQAPQPQAPRQQPQPQMRQQPQPQMSHPQAATVQKKEKAKPAWWTKVEGNRKEETPSETKSEYASVRSRYADMPGNSYSRKTEELPDDSIGVMEEKRLEASAQLEELNKVAANQVQGEAAQVQQAGQQTEKQAELDERSREFLAMNGEAEGYSPVQSQAPEQPQPAPSAQPQAQQVSPAQTQPQAPIQPQSEAPSSQEEVYEDETTVQVPVSPPSARQRAERDEREMRREAVVRERKERGDVEREYAESVPSQVFKAERPQRRPAQRPAPYQQDGETREPYASPQDYEEPASEDEFIDESDIEEQDVQERFEPEEEPEENASKQRRSSRSKPKKKHGFHLPHRNKPEVEYEDEEELVNYEDEMAPEEDEVLSEDDYQEDMEAEPLPETDAQASDRRAPKPREERPQRAAREHANNGPSPREQFERQRQAMLQENAPEPMPDSRQEQANRSSGKRPDSTDVTVEVPPVQQPQPAPERTSQQAPERTPLKKRHIPSVGNTAELEAVGQEGQPLKSIPSIERGPSYGDSAAAKKAHDGQGLEPLPSNAKQEDSLDATMASLKQPTPIDSNYSDTIQRSKNFRDQGEEAAFTPLNENESPDDNSIFDTGSFAAGETGAFVPVGNTGNFKPNDNDMVIDDADDETAGIGYGTDDFSEPQQLDMPKSRASRFGRKRRKKKAKEDQGAAEWLGLDKDYNPTTEGKDIGSWDHFEDEDDPEWKGGAASSKKQSRSAEREMRKDTSGMARGKRTPKEVWFLAVGASEQDNAGIKAFLEEHADELKGASFINLRAVGAGQLACLEKEGVGFAGAQSDHRLISAAKRAAKLTNHSLDVRPLKGYGTDALPVLKSRHRAMTLMAFEEKAPVAWQQSVDTSDVINDDTIRAAADIVTEIVRKS